MYSWLCPWLFTWPDFEEVYEEEDVYNDEDVN
jgi:hypothetical protein